VGCPTNIYRSFNNGLAYKSLGIWAPIELALASTTVPFFGRDKNLS